MWFKILQQCASFKCRSLLLTSFLHRFSARFFFYMYTHIRFNVLVLADHIPDGLKRALFTLEILPVCARCHETGREKKKEKKKVKKGWEDGEGSGGSRGWGAARGVTGGRATRREGMRRGAERTRRLRRDGRGVETGRCAPTGVWNRPDICSVCLSVCERDHKAGRVMETGSISPSHSKNTNTSG